MSCGYKLCHVVADQYVFEGLKGGTRKKRRGDDSAMQFTGDTQSQLW